MMNNKLKLARMAAGLTQAQVAKAAGVRAECYQRYEYGERVPRADVAILIAGRLGRTVEELFSEECNLFEGGKVNAGIETYRKMISNILKLDACKQSGEQRHQLSFLKHFKGDLLKVIELTQKLENLTTVLHDLLPILEDADAEKIVGGDVKVSGQC